MEEEGPTISIREDRGGLMEDKTNGGSSLRHGTSTELPVSGKREKDDIYMGNVQAVIRSDLLITHCVSEQDTLYLIKREETRETGDFWHKIDRARSGAQSLRVGAPCGDCRTEAVRVEKEPQENADRKGNEHDAVTRTLLSEGESQACRGQHSKAPQSPAKATLKTCDVSSCTEGEGSKIVLPRDCRSTAGKSTTEKQLKDETVYHSKQRSCLSKRAVQLVQGARRSGTPGDNGGMVKTGLQGEPRKDGDNLCDETRGAVFSGSGDAELLGPRYARGDLHIEDDFSFAIVPTPTKNELQRSLCRHPPGDVEEADAVGVSSDGEEGTAERAGATTSMQQQGMGLLTTVDRRISSFAVSPSPPAGVFARAVPKIQEDSTELLKCSNPATGDHQAVQLPQLVVNAAESDAEPILCTPLVSDALHRPNTSESSIACTSLKGVEKHEPEMEDREEKERATGLKGAVPRRWQETQLQKEHQEAQLQTGAQQQFSLTWQDTLLQLARERDGGAMLSGSPLQQQQQRESGQQQRQERQQRPAERHGQGMHVGRGFLERGSAADKDERSLEMRAVCDDGVREGASPKETDDNNMAFLSYTSLGSSGKRRSVDQRQRGQEDKEERWDGGEVERKNASQGSARMDRWSVRARTVVMKGGRKKEQWLSLAAGRRKRVHESECAGDHYSRRGGAQGGQQSDERPRLTNILRRCRSAGYSSSTGSTPQVSLYRGSTLQGPPATLARGNFFTALPRRPATKRESCYHGTETFCQDGKNTGSCANISKVEEIAASPPCSLKKSWQEACARLRSTGGDGPAGSCEATTSGALRQQQEAGEDWFLFRQPKHCSSWKEQAGGRTPGAWTTQDIGLGGCTMMEIKKVFSLGSRSTTADAGPLGIKRGSVDSERNVMLQRVQEIRGQFEAPCSGRDTPTTRTARQGPPLGAGERKTRGGSNVSDLRSSRVQCVDLTATRTKRESSVKRLLRTMMRGGGHRADELAHRWLDDASSEATSRGGGSSVDKEKERAWVQKGRKKEGPYGPESGDRQPAADPSLAEAERTSQSSGGTFQGWINVEKADEQDSNDEEERLSEQETSEVATGGENTFCSGGGGRSAEGPVNRLTGVFAGSCSAKNTDNASGFPPATPLQALAGSVYSRSSGSSLGSEKDPSNNSSEEKGVRGGSSSSSTLESGDNVDCSIHSRSLQVAGSPARRFVEAETERKSGDVASSMWHGEQHVGGAREGCTPTQGVPSRCDKRGEQEVFVTPHLEALARTYKGRVGAAVASDSPSSSVSFHAGWESLETETGFPAQQMLSKYDATAGTGLTGGSETRHTETSSASIRRAAVDETAGATQERLRDMCANGHIDLKEARYCRGVEECRNDVTAEEGTGAQEEAERELKVQEASSVCRMPHTWKRQGEERGESTTAISSSEARVPQGSGTSLMSLFGTAAGWSFLKKGWRKTSETKDTGKEEEAEDTQCIVGEDGSRSICGDNSLVAPLASGTFGTVEDSGERPRVTLSRGRAGVGKRRRRPNVCGWDHEKSSSSSRTDLRSSSSKGGTRPGGFGKHIVERSGSRSGDSGRNSSRRDPRVSDCSSNNPAQSSSGGNIGWGGRRNTSKYQSSISSSKFHSASGSICRSLSSHTFRRMSSMHRSSSDVEGKAHASAFTRTNMGMYVTSSDAAGTYGGVGRPLREVDVNYPGEPLQLRSTSVNSVRAASCAPCRKRLPLRTGGSGTGTRRRRSRVTVDKLRKNFYLCDSRRRRCRTLPEQLEEKASTCTVWRQGTGHLLDVQHGNSEGGKAIARPQANNDFRGCAWTTSLDSSRSIHKGDEKNMRKCNDSNDVQARFHEWPPWTLQEQPATAGRGVALQSDSRLSPGFSGVYPFARTTAHFFNSTPFSSALSTGSLVGTGAAPVSAAATGPLYATGVAAGGFMSPVYVSGAAAGCFPRLLPCARVAAPGAAAATACAAATDAQANSAVAQEGLVKALLPTGSPCCTAYTMHRHVELDGNCAAATAATTSPFWSRWPAAVLRVIGLPLRTAVHLLGLNVSGAYDRWRGEIRQRSLRGFLTLCLLDGVVCAATVWGVCHLVVFAIRGAFKTAYLHVHNIDVERTSHYFDGLTYRFWGKRPLYFTDNPLVGAGRAADAEIATDPWSGLHHLQQRGIAWYQHHMYGDL